MMLTRPVVCRRPSWFKTARFEHRRRWYRRVGRRIRGAGTGIAGSAIAATRAAIAAEIARPLGAGGRRRCAGIGCGTRRSRAGGAGRCRAGLCNRCGFDVQPAAWRIASTPTPRSTAPALTARTARSRRCNIGTLSIGARIASRAEATALGAWPRCGRSGCAGTHWSPAPGLAAPLARPGGSRTFRRKVGGVLGEEADLRQAALACAQLNDLGQGPAQPFAATAGVHRQRAQEPGFAIDLQPHAADSQRR